MSEYDSHTTYPIPRYWPRWFFKRRRSCPEWPIIAYSYEKVIKKLMKDGMSLAEAIEFFDFNQAGAWMGPTTPCFIVSPGE